MAAYGPAVSRIKYLLTGEGPAQRTPNTITGRPRLTGGYEILSYALPIVFSDLDTYLVYDSGSSLTTNRHVRAARMALAELGYTDSQGKAFRNGRTYERLAKPKGEG